MRLVIVGAGPRAVSLLDRLTVRLAHRPTSATITLVDPFGPGGRIWRRDQPPELLMNTFAGESSIFADPSHGELGGPGPDLYSWARSALLEPSLDRFTDAELAAMKTLGPQDYAPRYLFGTYVNSVFHDIVKRFPEGTKVVHWPDSVVEVSDRADGTQDVRTSSGKHLIADAVVLATGHTDMALRETDAVLADHAETTGAIYGPPALPTETPVDAVPAGADVVLRGMALNFFDIVAMLTEGRGGRFERDGSGLRYLPSGQEPRIHAGSYRGVPCYARIDQPGPDSSVSFFDQAFIDRVMRQAPDIDLRRDVWPTLVKEASWIYYERHATITVRAEDLERLIPFTPEWDAFITERVPDPAQRLDLDAVEAPLREKSFSNQGALNAWMLKHLAQDLRNSADQTTNPRAGVGAFMRAARGRVYPFMATGGLSGISHQRDARWFGAFLRTIGNGPPRLRIEQLAALARAGVVNFLGAGLEILPTQDGFVARSASLPGTTVNTRYVLDAYVATQDMRLSTDPLWLSLRTSGGARAHHRPNADGLMTQIGAVDVAEPTGQVVLDGGPHERRFVLGAPTEGARWNTPMVSRTGMASRFVKETDAIAVCLANAGLSNRL